MNAIDLDADAICPSCGPCRPDDHCCPACHAILLPDHVRVCNCAACKLLLLGAGQVEEDAYPPMVQEWISGRPYCERCARELHEDALTMTVAELMPICGKLDASVELSRE